MFKIASSFITLASFLLFLNGCSGHDSAMKTLPNELAIADECTNSNKQFEVDCYELIAYKNSFAQMRLGLHAQNKKNYKEALQRFNIAKEKGNFYVNSLIADMYNNGLGVPKDQDRVIDLLKDVKNVDPIAAYKLSFYYMSKEDYKEAVKLLTFAADNGVKSAQLRLAAMYGNGDNVEADIEKASYWTFQYENNSIDFVNKIYGL